MLGEIKEVVANALKISVENLDDQCSQKTQPLWDSLNHLIIMVGLEEKFGLSFEPEEMAAMVSIEEIQKMIIKKQKEL